MTQKFMLAALGICTICHGDQIDVPANGDIQAAIDAASNGDVIQLAAWSYEVENTLNTLGKSITIRGTLDPSGLHLTRIDGDKERRLFELDGSMDFLFEDISFEDGYSIQEEGGAILLKSSSVVVRNCKFLECWAGNSPASGNGSGSGRRGGGAFAVRDSSDVDFIDCLTAKES